MDAKTLCLGVLSRGGASGYEIRKAFEDGPFSHFYDVGYGSIYPALKRLLDDGLVTVCARQDERRPDKKVYRITAAGRARLYDEITQTPAADRIRSDLMFILFFGELLSARQLNALIEERLEWYRTALAHMAEADRSAMPPGERFVTGLGEAIYNAAARYLDEHRHELVAATLTEHKAAE